MNYYQIMGLNADATPEEIKSRFRFLAKAYHPDRFTDPESKAAAEREMQKINEAYSALSNPGKKVEYDEILSRNKQNPDSIKDDAQSREQLSSMLSYVQRIGEKWQHLNNRLDTNQLSENVSVVRKNFRPLLYLAFPGEGLKSIGPLLNQFDERIGTGVYLNVALGAENEINGLNKEFPLYKLLMISSMPILLLIDEISELARKRQVRLTREIDILLAELKKSVLELAQVSFLIGKTIVHLHAPSYTSPSTGRWSKPGNEKFQDQYSGSGSFEKDSPSCQICSRRVPTKRLTFRKNIGMLFMRQFARVEGFLCADCIEQIFWEFSVKTLFVGWLGTISLVITPFILLGNMFNYAQAFSLRRYSNQLGSIARGWKLLGVAGVLLVGYGLVSIANFISAPPTHQMTQNNNNPQTQVPVMSNISQTTRSPSTLLQPGPNSSTTKVRPTQTSDPCLLWSAISSKNEGQYLCVYGVVQKAYTGDELFYMTFSTKADTFRFVVTDGYYYEGVQGNCVRSSGIVKVYGSMPYIEVTETLYHCR